MLLAASLLLACDDGESTAESVSATAAATEATATPTPAEVEGTAEPGEAPPAPAPEAGDWSHANGGLDNTRARESAIDSSTVERLGVAWEYPLTGTGPYGAAAGAPVIADGRVYVQDLGGDVHALEAADGAHVWTYDGGVPLAGPNGPAVADGRVFATTGDSRFAALSSTTGEVLWSVELEKDGYQPIVVDGVVLIGTGNQAHVAGNSGFMHALAAETGERLWSFQVVEEGFWGNPDLNSGGGVWYPPAVDLERGLVYVGTGNAGPYPGTTDFPNASSRPGPNLYTSSIVALDLEAGTLEWYHQVVERGLFDHDFQSSPILLRATVDGEERDIAIGSGKMGRVLAFDLETHEVLWDTAVGEHLNDDLEALPPGVAVVVKPGIFGGVETPMAAADGRVFVPVVNLGTAHTATGHGATDGSGALLNAGEHTSMSEATGELVALEVGSGEVAWAVEFESPIFAGATAVGDLVFTATYDGTIYALRQSDGAEVWRYEAGGGINAWPAVGDDVIVWPVGLGPSPRVIAFGLEGGS